MDALGFTSTKLLQQAPDFILARFPSVITGMIWGYTVMIIFFGSGGGFFHRLLMVGELHFGLYIVSRIVRQALTSVIAALDKHWYTPSAVERKNIEVPTQD